MTVENAFLADQFEKLAGAPNGVAKLRELILTLAVQGKLVEQDPEDEPAELLLRRIAAEKAGLIQSGLIKAGKPAPSATEMPFDVPIGWAVTVLQAICTSVTDGDHQPPPKADSGIPFLVISNVRSKTIDFTECRHVPSEYYDALDPIRKPEPGDLLYTLVGSYGIPIIVRDSAPFCVQRHIGIIRPSKWLDVSYLAFAMNSELVFDQASHFATGTAQRTVPLSGLRKITLPLPPLPEQHRIVAKVDQLMALCDRLEAHQTQAEDTRRRLNRSALDQLLSADDTEEFAQHWQRICDNFDLLYDDPENVGELRKAILQLAVQGKLVEQDPGDEPAEVLLERLATEKEELVRNKEIPKPKALKPVSTDEVPPYRPNGWAWCRFEAVHRKLGAGSTPLGGKQVYVDEGVMFLRSQNVWNDGLRLGDVARIPPAIHEKMANTRVQANDVLLNITGASIARAAVVPSSFPEANVSQHVAIVRQTDPALNSWIHTYLTSPQGYDSIMGVQVGISREGLSMTRLREFVLPLPPLAEQHRIVAKVDQLMALCDQLEARLNEANTARSALLGAILNAVLSSVAAADNSAPESVPAHA